MNGLLLMSVVFGVGIQNIAKKAYSNKNSGGSFVFSAASVTMALIMFLFSSGGNFNFNSEIVVYSIGFALSYGASAIFSLMAIKTGLLSITALINSYSLIIPTFYGIMMLGEKAKPTLVGGIALLLVSLWLVNKKSETEKGKMTKKWLLYVAIAFAGNGICSTVQKVQQLDFNGQFKNEFMIIALVIVCVLLFGIGFFTDKGNVCTTLKKGICWYSICGIANGIVNLIMLELATKLPASLVFPVVSAGGIVMTALVSIFIYKEKLTKKQYSGMVLGIMSIVLLNL